jgi:hypothetical protein
MAESDWLRFPLGLAAMLEFILTGTVARYFAVAWRYGLFFTFPLIAIGGMICLSISTTRFAVIHVHLPHHLSLRRWRLRYLSFCA